jgi:hypothetical protein
LFAPTANGPFNAVGLLKNVDAMGIVGEMLGVPVVVDPQIADNTALVGRFRMRCCSNRGRGRRYSRARTPTNYRFSFRRGDFPLLP